MKTLALRIDDQLHAQLTVLAQLTGSTVSDAIRRAVEQHIASTVGAPEMSGRLSAALEQIDREANAKREAISQLLALEQTRSPNPDA